MTQTVLITGASSGFGQATAKYFIKHGWNVVATMRNPEGQQVLQSGDNLLVTKLDVENHATIEEAITEGIVRFGKIDAVVNNAGYGLLSIFEIASPEAIRRQFDVNVFGLMDVTRAILPHFRSNRKGSIINITSGAGVVGFPLASLYAASKFAVEGFSESLSYELNPLGIKVRLVEPGAAPQTNFIARTGTENGSGTLPPADYGAFLEYVGKVYENMLGDADADAVEKVVAAIYEAATDTSDRLRWTPTEDIQPLVHARRSTTEEQYHAFMRNLFAMK